MKIERTAGKGFQEFVKKRADLLLVLITICWSCSYTMTDICLEELSPLNLNAYRFLGGFLLVALLSFPKLKTVNRVTLIYSALIGVLLAIVYGCCTLGVKYTTLSNSAFLISTTVFVTPTLAWIFQKKRPSRRLFGALILCTIGIMLMTLKEDFGFDPAHLKGDIFSLTAGIVYAFELLLTEKAVQDKRVSPLQLGSFALLFCGLMTLAISMFAEKIRIPSTAPCWVALLFLVVFCTAITNVLQPICQQYTDASRAGIIFSLEPMFAAVFAFLIAGEVLSGRGFLGAILMLVALFYLELDFSAIFHFFGQKNRASLPERLRFSGYTVDELVRDTEVPRSAMFPGEEWVNPGPSGPAVLGSMYLREEAE